MNDYLQHYQIKITALSPIHIGNGNLIGKKEYIQKSLRQPVIIPDLGKMFHDLQLLRKDAAFERYMLGNEKMGLGQWMQQENIPEEKIRVLEKVFVVFRGVHLYVQRVEKRQHLKVYWHLSKMHMGCLMYQEAV